MVGFLGAGVRPFDSDACFASCAKIGRYDVFASCDCRDDEESEGERVEGAGRGVCELCCQSMFRRLALL